MPTGVQRYFTKVFAGLRCTIKEYEDGLITEPEAVNQMVCDLAATQPLCAALEEEYAAGARVLNALHELIQSPNMEE